MTYKEAKRYWDNHNKRTYEKDININPIYRTSLNVVRQIKRCFVRQIIWGRLRYCIG